MCARRAPGGLHIRPSALASAVVPGAALKHCPSKLPVHSGDLPPRQLPGAHTHAQCLGMRMSQLNALPTLPSLPGSSLELTDVLIGGPPAGASSTFPPFAGVCVALHFTACGWKGCPQSCHANACCCADELPNNGMGLCKPFTCISLPPRPHLQARWQRGDGRQRRGRRACGRSWGSCSTASSSSHRFVSWMGCCWLLDGAGQPGQLLDRLQQLTQLI